MKKSKFQQPNIRAMSLDNNISIDNDIFTSNNNVTISNHEEDNNNITISNYKKKLILTTNYQETISLDDDNISTTSNYEEELILYEIFDNNSHNCKDEDQEHIPKFI
ncbi:5675_t:CDS:2, partial [Dentiscutata heterogama]